MVIQTLRRALVTVNFVLTQLNVHNLPIGFTDAGSTHFLTTRTNSTTTDTTKRASIDNVKAAMMEESCTDTPAETQVDQYT